jgi:hypothetical protein
MFEVLTGEHSEDSKVMQAEILHNLHSEQLTAKRLLNSSGPFPGPGIRPKTGLELPPVALPWTPEVESGV